MGVCTCEYVFVLLVGTRRVRANEVYQEYIKDKNHYHMNATRVRYKWGSSIMNFSLTVINLVTY